MKLHDPIADPQETFAEYGYRLVDEAEMEGADAIILAVAHKQYLERGAKWINDFAGPSAIVVDIKSVIDPKELRPDIAYWSL